MTKYLPLSPDGFAIDMACTEYRTRKQAYKALEEWKKRYTAQGYYSDSNRNRIPIADLLDACSIEEMPNL